MLALRWHGRHDVRLEDVPAPAPPGPEEVQLRIAYCGICGTDIEEIEHGPVTIPVEPHPLTGARAPIVLGHEFTGVVDRVGDAVTNVGPGDRVACDGILACGECRWCRRGEPVRCVRGASLGLAADGGLAELCNAPAKLCFALPEGVAIDEGALAEPLAVAVRALRRGGLRLGERVAVVGAGTIGLMAVQAALALGAESVSVLEPGAHRRQLAKELGAELAVAPEDAGELAADVVVECAGNPRAVEAAIATADVGGRVVLVGIDQRPVSLQPFDLIRGERSIIGSISHVYDEDFRSAVMLLGRGYVRAAPLITDRIPLDRVIEDGIEALREGHGDHLKILVRCAPAPHAAEPDDPDRAQAPTSRAAAYTGGSAAT
jgi:(R,R)-butanediol dehydrogenase/meso-butanediol dehydrogenase/diacetyl reductase